MRLSRALAPLLSIFSAFSALLSAVSVLFCVILRCILIYDFVFQKIQRLISIDIKPVSVCLKVIVIVLKLTVTEIKVKWYLPISADS